MKKLFQACALLFSMICMLTVTGGVSLAAPVQRSMPIIGEVEKITIDTPGDVWSSGTMTVGGQVVILPRNLLINLPNDYQTLQQLYANAPPACQVTGETGLAKEDRCNGTITGAQVSIRANMTDNGAGPPPAIGQGNVIAGQVDISKALETVNGTITYINYTDGYFRVNGNLNDPTTGTMIRINDPTSRNTIQSGAGCAAGNTVNCSADVRFKIDPDNYTFCFVTGYPACIPSSVNGSNASGVGDPNCPDTNHPPVADITTNAPPPAPPVAADSRHFAPVKLGDPIVANGNFETVGGVTFLSAASVRVNVDLTSRTINPANGQNDPTQPEYLIINEAGWDGAAYPAGRVRGRFLTNSTNHTGEVDYYSVHYDPVNNQPHEQILYTTQFNRKQGAVAFNVPTGVFDSQIRMDFFSTGNKTLGDEPCLALRTGPSFDNKNFFGTPVFPAGVNVSSLCTSATASDPPTTQEVIDNFNLMAPAFREVMARSVRHEQGLVTGQATDIHGLPAQSGQYKLPTVLEYGAFEDINLGMSQFPYSFSGTPWLMDRRLSPNGCVGACEGSIQPLNPFPFEGIDPRTVSPVFGVNVGAPTPLPNPNRMFNFMQQVSPGVFAMTGLLSWPPANPAPVAITPVAPFSLFPPIADEDAATATVGVPVTINVLANDIAVFGTIDPATVAIATPPASGTAVVNSPAGTITFTPTVTGVVTFTYTVANNFGSVSLPGTVTVTVPVPPTAVDDVATTAANSTIPIDVVANDTVGTNILNLATVNIVSAATCGSTVNQLNGTVLFTAPATVPAAPGTCSFSYTVSDTSVPPLVSNIATVTVTVTQPIPPPPATSLSVFSNVASPQVAGTAVSFNASAGGGSGSYEYRYWLKDTTGVYTLVQPFSTSSTWNWNTTGLLEGTYSIAVQARSVGSTSPNGFDVENVTNFFIIASTGPITPATAVSLTASAISPQTAGTPVTFTGTASGGSGFYEYQYWLKDTTGTYTLVRPFSSIQSWTWDSTGALTGTYTIAVQARSAGTNPLPNGFDVENTIPFDIQ